MPSKLTVEVITSALKGHKAGRGWVACCPAHDDHSPSLAIDSTDDGTILVYCHAGCPQSAVIAALRARRLWYGAGWRQLEICHNSYLTRTVDTKGKDDARRTLDALSIWYAAQSAHGTVVEAYLQSRSIRVPPPPSIRFHPRLKHSGGDVWPAMVALVSDGISGQPLAVHRTFLAHDGASKAPVKQPKMMLGPCRGGVVRLATPSDELMVGEGIETCLSAMQASARPTWAALSTSGLRSLALPPTIQTVIILADGDEAGETAASAAADRWVREGRSVRIARAPKGADFNDLLNANAELDGERVP